MRKLASKRSMSSGASGAMPCCRSVFGVDGSDQNRAEGDGSVGGQCGCVRGSSGSVPSNHGWLVVSRVKDVGDR
jgi:hypothetical protein